MKISPRDKLIITAVGLLITVIALAALTIIPQYQQLQQIAADIETANAQVDASKSLLAQRQAAKDRSVETNAETLRLLNMVPENPEQAAFIIELQDAALDAGVEFLTMNPGEPSAGSSFTTLPMVLGVTGSWSDTIDFMRRLNQLSRAVRIVSFVAGGATAPNEDTQKVETVVTSQITLEAYAIPASASSPTTAAPAPAPAP